MYGRRHIVAGILQKYRAIVIRRTNAVRMLHMVDLVIPLLIESNRFATVGRDSLAGLGTMRSIPGIAQDRLDERNVHITAQ